MTVVGGEFDRGSLLHRLTQDLPKPGRYVIAFSGGLDSTVLLHLMAGLRAELQAPVSAIHVDHGLQTEAAAWGGHCRAVCNRLEVGFRLLTTDATPAPGQSPEAAARDARYRALAAAMQSGDMLLTAHHRDDQVETLLLQLLRGAGADGLAAMPMLKPWGDGWHARPLLDVTRARLQQWATSSGLAWVEDPSNAAVHADRNFLRHEVLPKLASRWPGLRAGITRSAAHCADAAAIISERAEEDLAMATGTDPDSLCLDVLRTLSVERQRHLLRAWLRRAGVAAPAARHLDEARRQFCDAASDRGPRIEWDGCVLRRYRDQAWITRGEPASPTCGRVSWRGESLSLGPGLGRVNRKAVVGDGVRREAWRDGHVEVGYRQPGLRCRLPGRAGSRALKQLLQEAGVPPWRRPLLPLLFIDDRLAAVATIGVCESFAASEGEPGWLFDWVL